MARVLVTGGLGFIGSHTCVALAEAGYELQILDNLDNSCERVADRIRELTGAALDVCVGDLRDAALVDRLFEETRPDMVVHFAGRKAVGESTAAPLLYYSHNVYGSLVLLEAMRRHAVRRLVFSSSCTVYGQPRSSPVREDHALLPESPYGRTKLVIEQMCGDLVASEPGWSIALLRYFNPVGAHPSGLLGEDPRGVPANLVPYVMQVAAGRLERVSVFGDDYPTADGTGVRDYIHVLDLAEGHVHALRSLAEIEGCEAVNLGTGAGSSVLEVIAAAERAVGRAIPYRVEERRAGDVAAVWADPGRANQRFGWRAQRDLEAMCADAWRFQERNPNGYS